MNDERYTLITGGSEGIGYELAKLFSQDGHNVIIVARNETKLLKVKRELEEKYKNKVKTISIDFTVEKSCEELIEIVDKKNIIVDNLINNVGIGSFGDFCDAPEGFEDKIIDINIRTVTLLTKYYMKQMLVRRSGNILNVASTAAFVAGPRMAMYYSTKAYVLSLTEALYEEGKEKGVYIGCLCPGPVRTEFQEKAGIKKAESAKKYLMDASVVAEKAYSGFKKKKPIIIPGFKNKIAVFGGKISPRSISRKVILKNNIE